MSLSNETIDKLIELKFPRNNSDWESKSDNPLFVNLYFKSYVRSLKRLKFEDIWKELPISIEYRQVSFYLYMGMGSIYYYHPENAYADGIEIEIINNNITKSAADMWIKLKEMGLI